MKLIEPDVRLWDTKGLEKETIIARAARVCYKSETTGPESDERLCSRLYKNKHFSMFRHYTIYYIIPVNEVKDKVKECLDLIRFNPYSRINMDSDNYYISLNYQSFYERYYYMDMINNYIVSEQDFYDKVKDTNIIRIYRFQFYITTSIDISRELNRKSPNNIAEESTRYCNYTKNKFDRQISIVKPYNWDETPNVIKDFYIKQWESAEETYTKLVSENVPAEIARKVLPLGTATHVVYTYTLDEWIDIIKARCYGVTGKPHPDAKLVVSKINNILADTLPIYKQFRKSLDRCYGKSL